MSLKAITDFSGYVAADLCPAAQAIHDGILAAGVTFIDPGATPPLNPPVTLADFQADITATSDALVAKASGALADTVAFNLARQKLEEDLSALGNYVNNVAKGDPAKLTASGFPTYDTHHPADYSAPPAPTDVRLRQGDVSSTALARFKPGRTPSMSEVQTCTGDPTVEANWKTAGIFSGGKALLTHIPPGTLIWVRIRTYGLNNVTSDWSDPAKIMVV